MMACVTGPVRGCPPVVSARSALARAAGVLLGALALVSAPAGVLAQSVDSTTWGIDPNVLAIARAGDTIYLGGSFRSVGPTTGAGVPCDPRTALALPGYPRVIGQVEVVLADGAGGWILGGEFSYVGSHPRRNLARILPDGAVANWAPEPDLPVYSMLLAGDTLFIGGDFNEAGGEARGHVAALSLATGAPLAWRCDVNSRVAALARRDTTLYIGGWFTQAAGQPRSCVAAASMRTGLPTEWQVQLDARVGALAVHDTTVFVGGHFWFANGELRRSLIAVGAESAALHPWDAGLERIPESSLDFGAHVNTMLIVGDTMFVAGSFSKLGGANRRGLAQLDLRTGMATAWDARAHWPTELGAEFTSLALVGDTLFVAGLFDSLGGQYVTTVGGAAALDATTGRRFDWEPRANSLVRTVIHQHGVVFVGGWFTSLGEWYERSGLAAIDARTGRLTDWNPWATGSITCMAVANGRLYVGGGFIELGGVPRSRVAAFDLATGELLPWAPDANFSVRAIAAVGDDIWVGGSFGYIGGASRSGLAALDPITGQSRAWSPQSRGDVYAIAVTDSVVYVGGDFLSMGGQPRNSLAAFDRATGLITEWNPRSNSIVSALSALDGWIYAGGSFDSIGGAPRSCLAAIDAEGNVTAWAPDAYGPRGLRVHALAAHDSTVYAGGYLSGVNNEPRDYFVAMDARTGALRREYPYPNGRVHALATAPDGTVYVGGGFGRIGRWPQTSFAAIHPAPAPEPPPPANLALAACAPNPARDVTAIHYGLPSDRVVTLAVFDLQGRLVAKPLDRAFQPAGHHQVQFATHGLRPGCYLCRLDAGGVRLTRRLVVIR